MNDLLSKYKTSSNGLTESEANKKIASSITDKLIENKLADAREKHGWVTVKGADTVVTKDK